MTLGEMKQSVAAYLNQDAATFQVNGVNLILQALDRASRAAQRRHDFEAAKSRITLSATLGVTYTKPGNVKKFEYIWLDNDRARGPIRIINEAEVHRRSLYSDAGLIFDAQYFRGYYSDLAFVVRGNEYYLFPTTTLLPNGSTTEISINADVISWFDSYATQEQDYEDHLLAYGSDYLLYFVVRELSYRLKSSSPADQLQISATMVEQAFQGLVVHDANVSSGAYNASLA